MIVDAADLRFTWPSGSRPVIDIESFRISQGERLFLWGPSGCGKSTLLALLAGAARPQSGIVKVLDQDIGTLSDGQCDRFRADHIGVIFQLFNLVPYLSVIQNITLPCRFSARRRQGAIDSGGGVRQEAQRLCAALGLDDRHTLNQDVAELSVGQQQRVAAARALIGAPELVIADEPTSALDTDLRQAFIKLLLAECRKAKAAVLFVSHDRGLARLFDRSVNFTELNGISADQAA
jgi:putative ABC transport system ATP-binding protein